MSPLGRRHHRRRAFAWQAEVVERQRALQDNQLRLKLMTTPIRQDWADICIVEQQGHSRHTDGRTDGSDTVKGLRWQRYFIRLFQNKKLVCWASEAQATDGSAHAHVIDLFDVVEVCATGTGFGIGIGTGIGTGTGTGVWAWCVYMVPYAGVVCVCGVWSKVTTPTKSRCCSRRCLR